MHLNINVECVDATNARDELMIQVNGEDIWFYPHRIDNNGTLNSPQNIRLAL